MNIMLISAGFFAMLGMAAPPPLPNEGILIDLSSDEKPLTEQFNRDTGVVRMVLILSPT